MIARPLRLDISMSSAVQVLDEILVDRKAKTNPQMEDDDFFEVFSAEQVLRHMPLIQSRLYEQSALQYRPTRIENK